MRDRSDPLHNEITLYPRGYIFLLLTDEDQSQNTCLSISEYLCINLRIPVYQSQNTRVSISEYPCINLRIPVYQSQNTRVSISEYPCINLRIPVYQSQNTRVSSGCCNHCSMLFIPLISWIICLTGEVCSFNFLDYLFGW